MRDIAAEADLSPGNLYHYFKGKDEILYFCQDRWLDRMIEVVRWARSEAPSPARALRHVLETHVRFLLDEVEGSAAHLEVEDCDSKLVTRAILGALNWTARWYRPEGPASPSSVAVGLADYLIRGLAARPVRRPSSKNPSGGSK